jgi:two-component system, OmpR family, response regulator ArlR
MSMPATKVLIVEDEAKIARFLQMELEHEGFATAIESNGRKALDRIMQENFDLVLLDAKWEVRDPCRRRQ